MNWAKTDERKKQTWTPQYQFCSTPY